MNSKPIYLSVIQEEIDGVISKEFFHQMSTSRLRDLISRRFSDGTIYYSKGVRDLALLEVERREYNSLVSIISGDIEFREEVIALIVESDISRHVAEKITSTESELMKQAKKYGLI
jgi:hypothetical protein